MNASRAHRSAQNVGPGNGPATQSAGSAPTRRAFSRIWDIVAILKEHMVQVRMVTSKKPGKIVYADDYQVVAKPPTGLDQQPHATLPAAMYEAPAFRPT